jgi:glucose/sorbosone dehydrogenase/type IX secretion system substrate protein
MKKLLLSLFCVLTFLINQQAQTVTLTPFVTGLTNPIDIKNCGDDRLFVAERNGRIRVINPDSTLRPAPFLDIISKVSGLSGEEGFLGFCFSPDYKTSGKFYVSYTAFSGTQLISVIEQYKVSAADSNIADPTSALRLITVNQPYTNHKGGNLMFGQDGYLYIFWGDGGNAGDPYGNGQNKTVLLAKILRIDVSNSTTAQPYAIPPTNPFADSTGAIRKEIWAYGLRNPFRDSFDPITNDFWIGDVGQNLHEEIDFQPAGDKGGHNYGWNIMEGFSCYSPASNCDSTGITLPIYDYPHTVGDCIIGGYVYRSIQSRSLWGTYIFADYVSQWIDGLKQVNGTIEGQVVRMLSNIGGGGPISFGVDRYYDQYVCLNGNATIYKLHDGDANPFPKAYFTPTALSDTSFSLQALEGRNITYQWLYENAPVAGATSPLYAANRQGTYRLVVTNLLGNKDTSQPFIVSASSVALESFAGERISNSKVLLTWETLAEQNNVGFEIQRKLESDTGFKEIAFVPSLAANGNSIVSINYSYTDTPVYKATIQYRLKQINANGSFNYSQVVIIGPINIKLDFVISPTPAVSSIYLSINNTDFYQYQLIDINGRRLLQNTFNGNNHRINVAFLETGIYCLKIHSVKSGESAVKKVLITH